MRTVLLCNSVNPLLLRRASILVQYIFDNLDFQSPFLVTYICNSLFLVYIPLWQLWILLGWVENPPPFYSQQPKVELSTDDIEDRSSHSFFGQRPLTSKSSEDKVPYQYSHMDVIKAALIISPLWFISNCLYNYSLLMTSVSSSTIIR